MPKKTPKDEAKQIQSNRTYWTVKDAARYLGVHAQTVYSWVNESKHDRSCRLFKNPPPVYRFGRNCVRLPIEEFLNWVESYRDGAR